MAHEEYLRRNLVHASAVGSKAAFAAAIDRLSKTKRPRRVARAAFEAAEREDMGGDRDDDLNRIDLEIDHSHQLPTLTPEQIEYLRKIEEASRYNPNAIISGPR